MKTRRVLISLLLIALLIAACQPAAAPAPAAKAFRVAVVMPSATTDMAFSQSMFQALKAIQT